MNRFRLFIVSPDAAVVLFMRRWLTMVLSSSDLTSLKASPAARKEQLIVPGGLPRQVCCRTSSAVAAVAVRPV